LWFNPTSIMRRPSVHGKDAEDHSAALLNRAFVNQHSRSGMDYTSATSKCHSGTLSLREIVPQTRRPLKAVEHRRAKLYRCGSLKRFKSSLVMQSCRSKPFGTCGLSVIGMTNMAAARRSPREMANHGYLCIICCASVLKLAQV
jgi:hypothetical protein